MKVIRDPLSGMKVVVEYLQYQQICRARLITSPSDGKYVGQSVECSSKAEALEVVETYNTFAETQRPISLEEALQRVRNNPILTKDEVLIIQLRLRSESKYKDIKERPRYIKAPNL